MVRNVGEDSVIGARIDGAHQHLVVTLLGAVVRRGQDQPIGDRPLGIDCDAGLIAEIAVEPAAALHLVSHSLRTKRAFSQTDHGPGLLARDDPGVEFHAAALLAVAEVELGMKLAARHGRGELDIGNAVITDHVPARGIAAKAGQGAFLHRIDRLGAFIRSGKTELPGQTRTDRTASAIEDAQGKHRTCAAIGNQAALAEHQFNLRRSAGIVDTANQFGSDFALGATNNCGQARIFAVKLDTAPKRYGIAATRGLACTIEGDRIDRAAIDAKLDLLVGAVADRNADRRSARVMIKCREQEGRFTIAQRQPVDIRPSSLLFGSSTGFGIAIHGWLVRLHGLH